VVVNKSLSLIGAGAATTIVDATGLSTAFYIDGLDNGGLSKIVIQGFTAENANFEGIAITNASDVVIWGNTVTNNDLSLDVKNSTCPGLPAWETAEGFDCGEGIHLSGVTYSTIANNVSQGNSGGILISDETGITQYNVIEGNTFSKNVYDCGITIPSHPPYNATNPFGVLHNTVVGNTSSGNGTAVAGAGAGILLADAVPLANVSGNVLANNTLTNNGLPGVTIHAHAANEVISDNQIVGNTIKNDGPDVGDAATPGPTGINVFGVSAESNNLISQNTISKEAYDIVTNTPALVRVHLNNLEGGSGVVGVDNIGAGTVDATQNYWGCSKGPKDSACSSVSGSGITYNPYLKKVF